MANLNFKYGINWAALKDKAIVDGTIYVTKEEKAMYVDLDGTRHRLGQIIDFQTWTDFNSSTTTPPQHPDAYYYIIDQNALLRYDSVNEKWNQINSTSTIATDLTKLSERIDANKTGIDNINTTITTLQTTDTANAQAIANEQAAREAAVTDLQNKINAETTRADKAEKANAADIDALESNVDNITKTYAKTTEVTEKVAELQGQITNNDTDIANLQDTLDNTSTGIKVRLTAVESKATSNAENITGLTTRADNVDTKIEALEAADNTNSNAIAAEEKARKEAVADLQNQITAETTRATGVEAEIKTFVAGNASAIDNHNTRITTNTTNITNLATLVGSLPENSNAGTVVDFVLEQMEAADAMTYKGGISKWSDLPTVDVEAGFTYVVTADFENGGESYYAGDLVIANTDQTDTIYSGGWTHVKTGYVASQENKLVKGEDNSIVLKSYIGTDLGSMTVKSDSLTVNTTTTAANATTVQIDFAWGTF